MKVFTLLLLASMLATHCLAQISEDDKKVINDGLQAEKDLAKTMQSGDFEKSLSGFGSAIRIIVKGIGRLVKKIGLPGSKGDKDLDDRRKEFDEINRRLDRIDDDMAEIKKAIEWAKIEVRLADIEASIRIMTAELEGVMRSNSKSMMEEYVRLYRNTYKQAGFKLYDSIVNNDHIFSQNILKAGLEYTDYHRPMNRDYMRGLISLMLKVVHIEVAAEAFEEDRGEVSLWTRRLFEVRDSMRSTDNQAKNAMYRNYKGESDYIVRRTNGRSHNDTVNELYNFLSEKYDWVYWSVIVYHPVAGWDNHAVASSGYVRFRYYGRNFHINYVSKSSKFNYKKALDAIHNVHCHAKRWQCNKEAAKFAMNGIRSRVGYGNAVHVLNRNGYQVAWKSASGRMATQGMWLTWGRRWKRYFRVFVIG